jgi:hypothetical protein
VPPMDDETPLNAQDPGQLLPVAMRQAMADGRGRRLATN